VPESGEEQERIRNEKIKIAMREAVQFFIKSVSRFSFNQSQ
jgi:acyl CoA:acetate/3-ketoacid CoA transferase